MLYLFFSGTALLLVDPNMPSEGKDEEKSEEVNIIKAGKDARAGGRR